MLPILWYHNELAFNYPFFAQDIFTLMEFKPFKKTTGWVLCIIMHSTMGEK